MERYPERIKARVQVSEAIRRGDLVRGCCEVCGKAGADAHHEDYSKPLEVRWFCQTHHSALHPANASKANRKDAAAYWQSFPEGARE